MNCASAHPFSDIENSAFSFCIACFAEIAKTYLNYYYYYFFTASSVVHRYDDIPDTYYLIRYSDSLTIKIFKALWLWAAIDWLVIDSTEVLRSKVLPIRGWQDGGAWNLSGGTTQCFCALINPASFNDVRISAIIVIFFIGKSSLIM